jgi:citrate lyase gamma subunit
VLIAKQFGVNIERVVDVINMLVKEAQIALKNITRLDVFMEKK